MRTMHTQFPGSGRHLGHGGQRHPVRRQRSARSGKVIEGTFTGADSSTVRLLLANGSRAEVSVADVAGIEFTARKPPPPPPPPPSPARAPAPVTVPAQTMVNVRLTEAINVDASKAGATYRAVVDDPVMIDGRVVIPRSAGVVVQAVRVEQSGTIKGSDKISLKANSIAFGGQVYEVVTAYVEAKVRRRQAERTKDRWWRRPGCHRRGHRRWRGAAIGAAVGGVTGAVVASQGQEHLNLPAETRLQFQLTAAVTVRP